MPPSDDVITHSLGSVVAAAAAAASSSSHLLLKQVLNFVAAVNCLNHMELLHPQH